MTISITHLSPLSVAECPSWCVAHRLDAAGTIVHLGEIIEVGRSRWKVGRSSSFQLRLAAVGGARPGLLLDDTPVSPHALLSQIERAAHSARDKGQDQRVGDTP